jgi:hypothetical protein
VIVGVSMKVRPVRVSVCPSEFVTVIVLAPAVAAVTSHTMLVAEELKIAQLSPLTSTVGVRKSVPVIVILVSAVADAAVGVTPVASGGGVKLKPPVMVPVCPSGLVTTTSTVPVPDGAAGTRQVIVSRTSSTVGVPQVTAPKLTVAPVKKFEPATTTV